MNYTIEQRAAELTKISHQSRADIIRGLQLVKDHFDVDETLQQKLEKIIDIISGRLKVDVERPEEVRSQDEEGKTIPGEPKEPIPEPPKPEPKKFPDLPRRPTRDRRRFKR